MERCHYSILCVAGLAGGLAMPAAGLHAQEATRGTRSDSSHEKGWQLVVPGRVESWTGEIKIMALVFGVISEVLVKVNDRVFAGEPLIRLHDKELRARVAAVEAQVGLLRRVRNDQNPSSKAAARRKSEDAVADAEKAVVEARSTLDQAAAEVRARGGSDAELDALRSTLSRTRERLTQQKAELFRIEADPNTPLPTEAEGQLNVARAELLLAEAAVEKRTIRAPIDGSVLQVNAKAGELVEPFATRPLVLLGEISILRVRAEWDERDIREIRIGQRVAVRTTAFRGREFAGKISFIAPMVGPARIKQRDQLRPTDEGVVEVLIDLAERGPLAVRMNVDVYLAHDDLQRR